MFEAVLHDGEVMGHRFLVLLARANLGRAAGRTGHFAEAQDQLEQALESLAKSAPRASFSRSKCGWRNSMRCAADRPGIRH